MESVSDIRGMLVCYGGARICARKLGKQVERWTGHVVEMLMLASWTSIGIMWDWLATRIGAARDGMAAVITISDFESIEEVVSLWSGHARWVT